MRKLFLPVLLLGLTGGTTLNPNVTLDFANCSSSGSSAQEIKFGEYVMTVTDEDVYLCWAATCASGGRRFPVGTIFKQTFQANQNLSCRSAYSTGDVQFTRAN